MSPFSTNTGLFSLAHDIEDNPGNVFGKTGNTLMKTYFLLDEKVSVIHQAERPFFLLTFLYQFGGLLIGLITVGYLITLIAQAKTQFLVRFTEVMFR